jgi:hypothetical protein
MFDSLADKLQAALGDLRSRGGPARVRTYIDEQPGVLDGRIDPGRVFDRVIASTRCPTATGR